MPHPKVEGKYSAAIIWESHAVKAIIFDLGNVLVFHDNALLFRRLAERAGLPPGEMERRVLGHPLWQAANRGTLDGAGIHREMCRVLGVPIPFGEFFELWSCHFTVHQEVLPWVEQLEGKVRRVLLSNTNALHVDYLRPRLPILERFDHLVLSCEVGKVKPERAIYEEALRHAGTRPEDTAFFDDVPEYVGAASQLGIHGRVFTTAAAFAQELALWGLARQ